MPTRDTVIPTTPAQAGRGFRSLSPAARVLVINQFVGGVGFFMVFPFLASYLTDDLGYGLALVGLILGLRNLSQQGLFLVGGSAADRVGCRPMIVVGCALRVVGFGLYAVVTSLPGIIAATVLTGVAGALFNPAVRTYLTHESPGRRAEVFSVLNVATHTGALVGPLLGSALLTVDFRLVALVGCATFAVLSVAQLVMLPPLPARPQVNSVLGSWWEVLANGRFVAFTLFASVSFVLYNQLYLALPLEAKRVTGSPAAISAVFVVSTLIAITTQIRLTTWCRRRWPPGTCVAVGLITTGAGFIPMLVAAPLIPTGAGAGSITTAALVAAPVLLGTVVLTVGLAITNPFVMDLLPVVGSERLTGTYYGFFYLVAALITAAVAALIGALIDLPGALLRVTPAAALLLLGVAGALGVAAMQRRGHLDPRPGPDPLDKPAESP